MSFFLVLLIPMTAFTVIIFRYISGAMEEQALRTSSMLLERIDNQLDIQQSHLMAIAVQVSSSDSFKSFSFRSSPTRAQTVISELGNILNANGFASEILRFDRTDEHFYSSTGSYTEDSFSLVYRFEDIGVASFFESVQACTAATARPVGAVRIAGRGADRYTCFFYPLYHPSSQLRSGTLVFLVGSADLENYLSLYSDSAFLELTILSPLGEIVYPNHLTQEETAQRLEVAGSVEAQTMTYDGRGYWITRQSSGALGWRYVLYAPRDSVLAPVLEIRTRAYALLVVALVAGVASAVLLTNYHYHPIRQLHNELEHATGGWDISLSELGQIRSMCAQLIREKSMLQNDRVKMHKGPAMRQYCLYKLLRGDIDEVADTLAEVIGGDARLWCVLVAAMDSGPRKAGMRKEDWLDILPSELGGEHQTLVMLSPEGRYIIALTAHEEATAKNLSFLERLRALLEDVIGVHVTLGVGNTYDSPTQAHLSYLEAMQALAYRFARGGGSTLLFQETDERPEEAEACAERIAGALERQDWNEARRQGDSLLIALTQASVPLYLSKAILSDTLRTLRRDSDLAPERMNALSVASIWDFDTLHAEFSRALEDLIAARSESGARETAEAICYRRYLIDHAYDVSFSLTTMADDFSLSHSRLNQRYKDCTGATIWDTVIRMRTQRAKELLLETEMTIQEIVALIGYQDVSSFVRRFKRTEGVTPGEYRQKSRA